MLGRGNGGEVVVTLAVASGLSAVPAETVGATAGVVAARPRMDGRWGSRGAR